MHCEIKLPIFVTVNWIAYTFYFDTVIISFLLQMCNGPLINLIDRKFSDFLIIPAKQDMALQIFYFNDKYNGKSVFGSPKHQFIYLELNEKEVKLVIKSDNHFYNITLYSTTCMSLINPLIKQNKM